MKNGTEESQGMLYTFYLKVIHKVSSYALAVVCRFTTYYPRLTPKFLLLDLSSRSVMQACIPKTKMSNIELNIGCARSESIIR